MQSYEQSLLQRGFTVLYQRHDRAQDTAGHLQILLDAGYRCFHLADPVDDLLERRVRAVLARHDAALKITATPML